MFLLVFSFCLYQTLMDAMGQTASHPHNLVLAHFWVFRARTHNFSLHEKKGKMAACCSLELLASDVGWPPERNFHLPTVSAVEDKVFQKACGYLIKPPVQ